MVSNSADEWGEAEGGRRQGSSNARRDSVARGRSSLKNRYERRTVVVVAVS